MSARRGVLSAGTFCVDFNKSIARWPSEDTTNEVLEIDRQGGGSGFNMALDLKRLDPAFPVEAMGVVGDDDLGRFLFGECDAHGVERGRLRALPERATMSVDAFNVRESGRRTHFYPSGRRARDERPIISTSPRAGAHSASRTARARMRRWTGRGGTSRTAGPRCSARPGAWDLRPISNS